MMVENETGNEPARVRAARGARIGVAVGSGGITATIRYARTTHRAHVPYDAQPLAEPDAPAIASAFRALNERLADTIGRPVGRARVSVALLPPLADARLVPLPPLRRREAEAVLRRDAARYFVGGNGPRAVAVWPGRRAPADPVLATAASLSLVDAVRTAAAAIDWRIEAVVPAHAAWLALSRTTPPDRSLPDVRVVIAVTDGAAHVIRLEEGRATELRRVPADWPDEIAGAAGAGPGLASILAAPATRDGIARALTAAGWSIAADTPTAAEAAADNVYRASIELTTPTAAHERRSRAARRARGLVAAAVVLVVGAAAAELWGEQRELDAVLARRAAIRTDVAPLLALRDSIGVLEARTASIRSVAEAAPRWTTALLDLALLLPEDTHVTTMHATGDTLFVEAAGARAGEALQALRGAGTLRDVRVDGIVERELEDGTTTVERFRLRARLLPPSGGARVAAGQESAATAAELGDGRTQ